MEQKEEERLVMHLFRKNLPDFPKGKLLPGESPDYLLRMDRRNAIGIELTRLTEKSDNLIDEIHLAVSKKNDKLSHYQNMKINYYWLLIYTNDIFKYKSGNIQNKLHRLVLDTGFDRIWLLDLFKESVFNIYSK